MRTMKEMVMTFAALSVVISLSFAGVALAAGDDIVARYGDKKITVADFERIVEMQMQGRPKAPAQTPQVKEAMLHNLVKMMVLADYARSKGFDKRPDIVEQVKLVTDNVLASTYLKLEVADKVAKELTDKDFETYYKSRQEEFKIPEQVKARHILVRLEKNASEADQKKAREKAEDILKKLKAGEDFAKLAAELSDDPGSKAKGGDLGLFSRGRMVPEFEKAAFSMKPGELSEPVKSPFGYHIIKVEEKKEALSQPYEKVKDKVKEKATAEFTKNRVEEEIKKATAEMKVEIHTEALKK